MATGEFELTILGRLLEHLGVQMYKRRDVALAELVANAWDAGSPQVEIRFPTEPNYDPHTAAIQVVDSGCGMSRDAIEHRYLVVGRDKRTDVSEEELSIGRKPMGRKGIGKLAGFGLAKRMTVLTWSGGSATEFAIELSDLTSGSNDAKNVKIPWQAKVPPNNENGTLITLTGLKHKTPLDEDRLRDGLARRFSRTVRGQMKILVNGVEVGEPDIKLESRVPTAGMTTVELADGKAVNYWYGFAVKPIPHTELRGFTVQARGRTAQAPPFFFNIEGQASGQHGTRYITGTIEADFVDDYAGEDLISTDRQELDWESEALEDFRKWGERFCRDLLMSWAKRKGDTLTAAVLEDQGIRDRVDGLDPSSRKQVKKFLRVLAKADPDPARSIALADALVQAYEFRQFHDVIDELEAVAEAPDKLLSAIEHLERWQVLESRAILEVIRGRLTVTDILRRLVIADAPETAPRVGAANLHDLLAEYPWLIHPEWQTLSEEKSITQQLREWNAEETNTPDRERYDFLALTDQQVLVVVEIKRPGHAVTFDELQRLERYGEKLARGTSRRIELVLIYGGTLEVREQTQENWRQRDDTHLSTWSSVVERIQRHYEHYRDVLERNVVGQDFQKKTQEVASTRRIVQKGSDAVYRGADRRKDGVGVQDVSYDQQDD